MLRFFGKKAFGGCKSQLYLLLDIELLAVRQSWAACQTLALGSEKILIG